MERSILIIDGDRYFVRNLSQELINEGYLVDVLHKGAYAIDEMYGEEFDMVLMELDLEDVDGRELCREIRNFDNIPIIIITSNDTMVDKLVAFESGADDYLVKPFNYLELKARMKAIFKRQGYKDTSKNIGIVDEGIGAGNFVLNPLSRTVRLYGQEVFLTSREFDIFYTLITHPGMIFIREDLLDLVWGEDYFGEARTIDVHIRRIREKLQKISDEEFVMTKWGVGYYFNPAKL